MIRFLSADQVVAMHEDLLEKYGGDEGGGHRGASYEGAEAAIQAVKNSYYESVAELAAAYAVYIVQGHVFMDSNKRAASAAMLTFFDANNGVTRLTKEKVKNLMFDLQVRAESGDGTRTDDLVAWIASKL